MEQVCAEQGVPCVLSEVFAKGGEGGKALAEKVLEINAEHPIYETLKKLYETDKDKLKTYSEILYDQALLVEGIPLEDPVAYTEAVTKLMK